MSAIRQEHSFLLLFSVFSVSSVVKFETALAKFAAMFILVRLLRLFSVDPYHFQADFVQSARQFRVMSVWIGRRHGPAARPVLTVGIENAVLAEVGPIVLRRIIVKQAV